MSESGISAPAEQTLFISDKWLDQNGKNPHAFIDIQKREPASAIEVGLVSTPTGVNGRFEPRGFSINNAINNGNVDDDLYFGWVKRGLKSDPNPCRIKYATGIIHSDRIRFLYAMGTTARGIAIRA